MEVIEITIQIEPGTEEIHIAAESKELGPEMVIYIDGQGKVMLVDMEDALKIMDNFGTKGLNQGKIQGHVQPYKKTADLFWVRSLNGGSYFFYGKECGQRFYCGYGHDDSDDAYVLSCYV